MNKTQDPTPGRLDAVVMASAAPKERPILFSGPMVRAILEGRKTQTRRVLNLPRGLDWYDELGGEAEGWFTDGEGWWHVEELACRYGNPGDRLWVRETWSPDHAAFYPHFPIVHRADFGPEYERNTRGEVYSPEADDWYPFRWRPSIHMPRWASRVTLEITGVRVERLNDLTDVDAIDEGVLTLPKTVHGPVERTGKPPLGPSPREQFATLWESINGPDSWAANPWVWVVEFKRLNEL